MKYFVTETENCVLYKEVLSNLEPISCSIIFLNTLMRACQRYRSKLKDPPMTNMTNFDWITTQNLKHISMSLN